MKILRIFLSFVQFAGLIFIPVKTKEGVAYYVSPTVPLNSCPENSSCPPGQITSCNYTLDYLTEHSSEFFSPDQVSVTLIFMCGVHKCTKDLNVQNLHSFVMKGTAESRENVIIDHQFFTQFGSNCTVIQFFNISFVNITNMTMRCPSMYLKESHITVKNSNFYGHPGTKESLSFISITGRGSQALLDNCTFRENCFVMSNFSDGIIVSNSTFQSYRHQINSIIVSYSSVVTLTGNVNFTDSVINVPYPSSGTAVFLRNTRPELKSSLNITTGAIVYLVNLTCRTYGGAVYGENSEMYIGIKARVVFMYNRAHNGGAVSLINGKIVVGAESNIVFVYNHAHDGGAIWLHNGALIIDSGASMRLSHNSVTHHGGAVHLDNGKLIVKTDLNFRNNSALRGGAIYLENSTIYVSTDTINFYDNSGDFGGAIYFTYGTMYINSNKSVKFIMNTARYLGGAISVSLGDSSSIIVGNFAKLLFIKNCAFQGGALCTIPSSFTIAVGYQSSVQFINNTASDVGGAVYSEMQTAAPCLFMVTDYSAEISFIGNYANHSIGHHMYGTSVRDGKCDKRHIELANKQGKPYCWHKNETACGHINISFDPGLNGTLSPVSSPPQRVCLCDSNDKPQCANFSLIFVHISIYRGETFTLSAHVVGYDFGTTIGIVHARFLSSSPVSQLVNSQDNQPINSSEKCTNLEYTLLSKYDKEVLLLQTSVVPLSVYADYKEANKSSLSFYKDFIQSGVSEYFSHNDGCLHEDLLNSPVYINITLLPGCPPGLTLNHDSTRCSCYPILANNDFKCLIRNNTSFLLWNSSVWVNTPFNQSHGTDIIYNRYCPLNYCKSGSKVVNIRDDPSKQCASNRTGIMCGACMENFSLAIGSSQCIECPNSHNMALLLAFAAAGVFLVLFILALNLTVTQGLINGVIFYVNIVWAYKIILFPSEMQENHWVIFLQVFVAWLNLDFGIEACFFVGLDAYWKTWLQFLFPLYVWTIAGVIIVACRYSFRITHLIGSRAVPLLATLFLLSYMKLLRTVLDATSVALIAQYPQNTSYAVWYLDGNLRYCQHPHIYLFIATIATLVFLWLPYTLLLLFIQPLRRVSHRRPLKWINKLAPVYDAYFSPLKDKHQYWFGAMLLVRGILLVILTITSAANPELNMFVLFQSMAFLFFFMSVKNVYKQMSVRLFESATLLNLIVLSAGTLYKWESAKARMILLEVLIGISFAQFCVIVIWSCLIKPCLSAGWRCRQNQSYDVIDENIDDIAHERIEDPELKPLISYTFQPITMTASAKYTATATQVNS